MIYTHLDNSRTLATKDEDVAKIVTQKLMQSHSIFETKLGKILSPRKEEQG